MQTSMFFKILRRNQFPTGSLFFQLCQRSSKRLGRISRCCLYYVCNLHFSYTYT
ncbi:hypothetical protein Barb6_01262 [Bacteroidales bacterium Barb6]|nr:hypothetical protein Barb6_01262 [Bacteroidales bacterium Barb6]